MTQLFDENEYSGSDYDILTSIRTISWCSCHYWLVLVPRNKSEDGKVFLIRFEPDESSVDGSRVRHDGPNYTTRASSAGTDTLYLKTMDVKFCGRYSLSLSLCTLQSSLICRTLHIKP